MVVAPWRYHVLSAWTRPAKVRFGKSNFCLWGDEDLVLKVQTVHPSGEIVHEPSDIDAAALPVVPLANFDTPALHPTVDWRTLSEGLHEAIFLMKSRFIGNVWGPSKNAQKITGSEKHIRNEKNPWLVG